MTHDNTSRRYVQKPHPQSTSRKKSISKSRHRIFAIDNNLDIMTAMSSTENESAACTLLDTLPAELRNRIYEFAFSSSDDDRTATWTGPSADELEPASLATQHLPPPLLQTCRQIRSEAMGMWKANVSCFVYTDALNLGRFARLIGFENFLKINKLVDSKMWTTQREAENAIMLAREHLFGMGLVVKKGVFEASWQSVTALTIQGAVWVTKGETFMIEMGG